MELIRLLALYRKDLSPRHMEVLEKYARAIDPSNREGVVQLVRLIQTLASPDYFSTDELKERVRALQPHLVSL